MALDIFTPKTNKRAEFKRKQRLLLMEQKTGIAWLDYCKKKYQNKPRTKLNKEYFSLRQKIFDAYGQVCKCCGETLKEVLTIDHVRDDGYEERTFKKLTGMRFFKHIIKYNFPKKYQVLCYNCNYAKHRYGVCPHRWQDQTRSREYKRPPFVAKYEDEKIS